MSSPTRPTSYRQLMFRSTSVIICAAVVLLAANHRDTQSDDIDTPFTAQLAPAPQARHIQRISGMAAPSRLHVSQSDPWTGAATVSATPVRELPRMLAAPPPKALSRFVVSDPLVPVAAILAETLQPLADSRSEFSNLGDWSDQATTLQTMEADAGQWQRAQQEVRVERFERDAQGNLRLIQLEDVENNLIIRFTDPPIVFETKMRPLRAITSRSPIEVFRRSRPDRRIETGTARLTITYDADQTLETPAGRFDCHRLIVECEAEFGLGSLEVYSTMYHADGVGLVAEHYTEEGRVLIFGHEVTRTLVLNSVTHSTPIQVTAAAETEAAP